MTVEAENLQPEETMPAAIVKAVPTPMVIKTTRALVMQQALEEEREQRQLLSKYVAEFMIDGEDYGLIPGVKKKSLFKPGAEKLTDLFRCRPEYEIMAKEVNHETGLFYYEIRCRAVNRETDTILNEGVGSASSYESKYRYRNAGRVCPKCGKDSIIKGKEEYGGGWVCFAKKGGCGAKWADDAPEIMGQEVGKIQNPDLADVANVVLKMAKKRAQVDCALALARVSDMFTQDVEDMPGMVDHVEATQTSRQTASPPHQVSAAVGTALWQRLVDLRGKQARMLWDKATDQIGLKGVIQPQRLPAGSVPAMEAALFPPVSPDDAPEPDARDI